MAEKKRRKPVDKTKIEYVEPKPSWIKAVKVNDPNDVMGSIIQFFLVESPCKGVSSRGISLLDYGWADSVPPKSGYLHQRLLEVANLRDGSTLFTATRKEEMKNRFVDADMPGNFASTCTSNRVVALINSNFVLDLFRIIRNSLAHCRFQLVEKNGVDFIAFENGMPGKDIIGADSFEVSSRFFLNAALSLIGLLWLSPRLYMRRKKLPARKRPQNGSGKTSVNWFCLESRMGPTQIKMISGRTVSYLSVI